MNRIAVFASGTGSNAGKLMEHFVHHPQWSVALLATNNPSCGATQFAEDFGVPVYSFIVEDFEADEVLHRLQKEQIDAIVLAGFMRKIPSSLISLYKDRILNLHPALLPKFGGKGMFGMNVHRAVIETGETESGITIHLVNEVYDEGEIIAQFKVPVKEDMSPEELAKEVRKLEHKYYPQIVEEYLMSHAR